MQKHKKGILPIPVFSAKKQHIDNLTQQHVFYVLGVAERLGKENEKAFCFDEQEAQLTATFNFAELRRTRDPINFMQLPISNPHKQSS